MNIPDVTMERVLTQANLVSTEQLTALKEEAARSKRSLQALVLDQKITDIIGLTKAFAAYAQIDYVELNPNEIPDDVINKIPERIARQYNAVLFKVDEDGVHHLAMEDPDDIQAVNFIQKEIGSNTHIYIATHENILAALEEYHSNVDQQLNDVIDVQREQGEKLETVTEQDIAEDSPIAQTVNLLLEYAIRSHASDIHIEPREEYVQIRYRIDGVLREVNRLPKNVEGALISRIKIMANLKIDERRVPQDGRFKIKIGGKQYALRVSSMPVNDGEKVVMRILDESSEAISLESLGYWGRSLDIIHRSMILPNGMILFTGPTGSGKSTSLFSILTMLNKPTVNIATIEDPVEYRVPGVNQTQVNPKAGMTFANGLRALLRQDPNIIMVGEIRDGETAGLGIQASLTGHMVFSTLHTNNAATTLPRLLDMQIEPFLIASTVTAVVGQRLVRRLDYGSRQSFEPSQAEKDAIIKLFNIPAGQGFSYIHELEKQAMAAGVGGDTPLSTDENGILRLWKADETANTDDVQGGYKGRVGIYEVLENTEPIQRLIMANANSIDIQAEAIKEGMLTMQNDGLIKALRGETTVQEVLRVSKD
jgi:type IV pilus assembly protein PilB